MPSAFNPWGRVKLHPGRTIAGAGAIAAAGWIIATAGSPSGIPTCTLASPTSGTLSGTQTLTATCDKTPASVTFEVDGATIGTDSSSPFTVSWDTTGFANGTHNITVVGTAANGARRSSAVSVTTSNASPATANIWVASNGSDSGANCTRSASPVTEPTPSTACLTFSKAYSLAQAGDLIYVLGGSYPRQMIARGGSEKTSAGCNAWRPDASTATAGTTSGCVTIQTLPGNAVTLDGSGTGPSLVTSASYLRIVGPMTFHNGGITINANSSGIAANGSFVNSSPATVACAAGYAHDLILQNITVDEQGQDLSSMTVEGAQNVSFIGDSFGNSKALTANGKGVLIESCNNGTSYQGDHVLVDGDTFHDMYFAAGSGAHQECIHHYGFTYSTIINTKFQACDGLDLAFETASNGVGVTFQHTTVENNFFGAPGAPDGPSENPVRIDSNTNGSTFDTFTIRNNSFDGGGLDTNDDGLTDTWTNNVFTGNLLNGGGTLLSTCHTGWTIAKNALAVASGTGCGSDIALGTTTLPFVNSAGYDLHLDSGKTGYATAVTAVPSSTGYPATDIDGDTRPNPAAAGADQP